MESSAPLPPDGVLSLVQQRRQHALNRYLNFFRRISRFYDLYRGIYAGKFAAYRNNVHLPLLFSVIQSDVARKVQTSFGAWPIVQFTGYSHEETYKARKNEVLVSAQMKDCGSFEKAVDFYTSADMYGTAIARVGWKTDIRKEKIRLQDPAGGIISQTTNKTYFEGPDWDVVDILDFWPQPGKKLKDADWVIHRYYKDLDELERMAATGYYDQTAINQLKQQGTMPSSQGDEWQTRVNVYRSYNDYEARRSEKFAKPVEIWEMWGKVPSEFASDGIVDRVITIANGKVVLRNRPNPFWHGQIPFLAYCPQPDPHYFHGPGKIEIAEKMQYTANRLVNQKLDALDLTVDPMWLANSSLGIDSQALMTKAGRVIKIDGPIGEDMIRTLSPDLRGLQAAYQEVEFLWQAIQQSTGIIEDTVQGAPASRRQTAREFMGRQENVLTRLMLEARLAEECFVEPLADLFVAMNKQFLPVPKEIRILGSDAMINPITGMRFPTQTTTMQLDDIVHDYRARAVGSTQMLGKQLQQQQLMTLMQVAGGNPVAAQMINWTAFIRQLFEVFDLKNVDELLLTEPTQMNKAAEGPTSPQQAFAEAGNIGMTGV